jgi:hypothetical protein
VVIAEGDDEMSNITKAFPDGAEAFEKYIKRGIACVVFPALFWFFRPHCRCVLKVTVK